MKNIRAMTKLGEKTMKNFGYLIFGILLTSNVWASSLEQRIDQAIGTCLKKSKTKMEVLYTSAPSDMIEHYNPSTFQKGAFNIFRGVYDEFGGVLQGALSGDDEVHVKPYLQFLGKKLKKKMTEERLSKQQGICLASCMTNQLMDQDFDLTPTTSMERSVAIGRGFCRHFVLATDEILKSAGISSQYGFSFDHIFFYFQNEGQKVIFDPLVNASPYICEFYEEIK